MNVKIYAPAVYPMGVPRDCPDAAEKIKILCPRQNSYPVITRLSVRCPIALQ